MARRVIGYVGGVSGATRRPVYSDDGPARGRVGQRAGDVGLGEAPVPDRILIGGHSTGAAGPHGAGEVERRQATSTERAAWDARSRPAPVLVVREPTRVELDEARERRRALRESLGRGAGSTTRLTSLISLPRHEPPVTAPRALPRRDPVVAPITPPPITPPPPRPVEAAAPPPLDVDILTPCDDCAHRVVCGLRSQLTRERILIDPTRPLWPNAAPLAGLDGIRIAAVSIECDHFLEERPSASPTMEPMGRGRIVSERRADPAVIEPTPTVGAAESVTPAPPPNDAPDGVAVAPDPAARRPRGAGPVLPKDRDERDRLVLAAVRGTATTTLAGERLGVSGVRVQQIIAEIRHAGALPTDVEELLRGRRLGGGQPVAATA